MTESADQVSVVTMSGERVQTAGCRHCRERIWPNWTLYGPVWFAVKKHESGCEEYECPGQPFPMRTYGPHEPAAP